MARVTLKTIAAKTGYSITTISRALAGYDDVAPIEEFDSLMEELYNLADYYKIWIKTK